MQDVQRAFGLVRQKAKAWELDANRIGVLGFSAGGHLSATASTNYSERVYKRIDTADDLPCRPDFTVLVYPAYLVDNATKTKLEPEFIIDKNTPPAFLVHAGNDRIPPKVVFSIISPCAKRAWKRNCTFIRSAVMDSGFARPSFQFTNGLIDVVSG